MFKFSCEKQKISDGKNLKKNRFNFELKKARLDFE